MGGWGCIKFFPVCWTLSKRVDTKIPIRQHLLNYFCNNYPDPPFLVFGVTTKSLNKASIFLHIEPLNPWKKPGKMPPKSKENGKRKKARKSKKARKGGSGDKDHYKRNVPGSCFVILSARMAQPHFNAIPLLGRTILGSSRAPFYQRDLC